MPLSNGHLKSDYRKVDIVHTVEGVSAHIAEDTVFRGKIESAFKALPHDFISQEVAANLAVLGMQLLIKDAIASASTVEGENIVPDRDQIVQSMNKLLGIRSSLTLDELKKLLNEYDSTPNTTRGTQIAESLSYNVFIPAIVALFGGVANNMLGILFMKQSPGYLGSNMYPQVNDDVTDFLADKLQQVLGKEVSADMLFWLLVLIFSHIIIPHAIALLSSTVDGDSYKKNVEEVKKISRFQKRAMRADLVKEYMEKEINAVTHNFYEILHEIESIKTEIATLELKNPADSQIPKLKAQVYIRLEMLKKLSQGEKPSFEYEIGGRKYHIYHILKYRGTPVRDEEFEGDEAESLPKLQVSEKPSSPVLPDDIIPAADSEDKAHAEASGQSIAISKPRIALSDSNEEDLLQKAEKEAYLEEQKIPVRKAKIRKSLG